MYNQLYLTNMWLKFLINWIKIDGVIALRRGPEIWREKWCEILVRNFGAEKFPTDCYGEINRYERRPSGFMKKMNGGLYRVSRFARDNYFFSFRIFFVASEARDPI